MLKNEKIKYPPSFLSLLTVIVIIVMIAFGLIMAYFLYLPDAIALPINLLALLIVFLFILFYIFIEPKTRKLFINKRVKNRELLNKALDGISHIRDVKIIANSISSVIYKILKLKYLFLIRYYKKTGIFDLLNFRMDNISGEFSDINALKAWIDSSASKIYQSRIYYKRKKEPEVIFGELKDKTGLNINCMIPVHISENNIIICFGEIAKKSLKKFDIYAVENFLTNADKFLTDTIILDERNRDQYRKGILDLSSEIISKTAPKSLPKLRNISFGSFYLARHKGAVDYFDFLWPTKTGIGVIATEIPLTGLKKAEYTVILRSAFHSCIEETHSSFMTMQRINKAIYNYRGKTVNIPSSYFYFSSNTMGLTYTNAAYQPLEIFRVEKNIFVSLNTEGAPLGMDDKTLFGMVRTNLLLGDIGFLYSKSMINSLNKNGEKFELTQLREIVKGNRRKSPGEITAIIKDSFTSFLGGRLPAADVLFIIFKI